MSFCFYQQPTDVSSRPCFTLLSSSTGQLKIKAFHYQKNQKMGWALFKVWCENWWMKQADPSSASSVFIPCSFGENSEGECVNIEWTVNSAWQSLPHTTVCCRGHCQCQWVTVWWSHLLLKDVIWAITNCWLLPLLSLEPAVLSQWMQNTSSLPLLVSALPRILFQGSSVCFFRNSTVFVSSCNTAV